MCKPVLFAALLVILATKFEARHTELTSVFQIKHDRVQESTESDTDLDEGKGHNKSKLNISTFLLNFKKQHGTDNKPNADKNKKQSSRIDSFTLHFNHSNTVQEIHNSLNTDDQSDEESNDTDDDSADAINTVDKTNDRNENEADKTDTENDETQLWKKQNIYKKLYYRTDNGTTNGTNNDKKKDDTNNGTNNNKTPDNNKNGTTPDNNKNGTIPDNKNGTTPNNKNGTNPENDKKKKEEEDKKKKEEEKKKHKHKHKKKKDKKKKKKKHKKTEDPYITQQKEEERKRIACKCPKFSKDINNLFCASNWESYYSTCMMDCEARNSTTKLKIIYDGICRPYYE